jgi:hypothetical protein
MKLIKFLFAVIVALVIGNVTLTNTAVDEGIVVARLTKEIAQIQNDNAIMAAAVASSGSLGALSAQLDEAGFVESPKVVAIPTPASVASR